MLLVVFGAGASFDSVPDRPATALYPAQRPPLADDHYENDRPPLANQLFDNRAQFVKAMSRFPACLPLIPRLRKPAVVVERELAGIREQSKEYLPAFKELASILYYLHLAIYECQMRWQGRHAGITNHATFLREIERWRVAFNEKVCLVTFNYDTILDEELQRLLSIQFENIGDYAQENYSLIKLHGSVNWGRELDEFRGPHRGHNYHDLINAARELPISSRYRIVSDYPMYQMPKDGALVFPALSVPVENKDEFSCPATHVRLLEEMLPKVTKIITIGWRATEAEFLSMLKAKLSVKHPQLMIVSGDPNGATETFNNLTGNLQRAATDPYADFFPPGALMPGPSKKITAGFTGLINHLDDLETFLRN